MSSKDGRVELLQGTLDLIVLRALETMGPLHAYALASRLAQVSDHPLSAIRDQLRKKIDTPMTEAASATKEPHTAASDMFMWGSAASGTPVVRSTRERTVVTPLAPARYKLQMTLGADTVEKLRRAQDLLTLTRRECVQVLPDG